MSDSILFVYVSKFHANVLDFNVYVWLVYILPKHTQYSLKLVHTFFGWWNENEMVNEDSTELRRDKNEWGEEQKTKL